MVHVGSYPNRAGHCDSNELVDDLKHRGLDYISKLRFCIPYTGVHSSGTYDRASREDYLFRGNLDVGFTSGCS